jgi:protein-L-isoaspartate(D-aspartate) O-methyltransferase
MIPVDSSDDAATRRARETMVREQLAARGIDDPRVLATMRTLPRHWFVPPGFVSVAYEDRPLSIGHEQTISQPYVVAAMTQALRLVGTERVLEVGTGSGYQTAILAELCGEVYSIEIEPEIHAETKERLLGLGYRNVHLQLGDGTAGWPEAAPFDRVLVGAAAETLPPALLEQLAPGGMLIAPLGRDAQELTLIEKTSSGQTRRRSLMAVRFVPIRRRAEQRP